MIKKMKFDKKDAKDIFENAISWIVVLAMFIYGGAKIIQFDGAAEINKTVSEMSGMELMWAFYGYSKAYAITLGVFEVLGGILLLIKRTRMIGSLLISAILVNVIFQDIYFGVNQGALRAALLYQMLIVIILYLNKEKIIHSIRVLLARSGSSSPKLKILLKLAMAFMLFVVLRIAEYWITIRI
jgi:hypothetical protein